MAQDFNPNLNYRRKKGNLAGWAIFLACLSILVLLALFGPEARQPAGHGDASAEFISRTEAWPLFWAAFGLIASILMAVLLKIIVLPLILIKSTAPEQNTEDSDRRPAPFYFNPAPPKTSSDQTEYQQELYFADENQTWPDLEQKEQEGDGKA